MATCWSTLKQRAASVYPVHGTPRRVTLPLVITEFSSPIFSFGNSLHCPKTTSIYRQISTRYFQRLNFRCHYYTGAPSLSIQSSSKKVNTGGDILPCELQNFTHLQRNSARRRGKRPALRTHSNIGNPPPRTSGPMRCKGKEGEETTST